MSTLFIRIKDSYEGVPIIQRKGSGGSKKIVLACNLEGSECIGGGSKFAVKQVPGGPKFLKH